MNREYILAHVEELTVQQLFESIIQGIVTLEELRQTENLDATKRNVIIGLLTKHEKKDDNTWETARSTEQGCHDYLTNYPAGRHRAEAQQQIEDFEQKRNEENEKKNQIVEQIRNNPNADKFTPGMLRKYLDEGLITTDDLSNAGIPNEIIKCLDDIRVQREPDLGITPNSIPDRYTEVYFWGIPGSGKTCALAAILSTATKEGFLEIAQGPGYNYMLQLQSIFLNPISFLPGGTPTKNTQYLPFTLKKPTEKHYRSISLIELSGEIFECFLFKNANKPLPSPEHEETFNSLLRFINSRNRKIHFFFVDYQVENNPDENGYTQSQYLNAAATFFNNPQNNLFGTTTDAVYIVLTKSDLMPCKKSERVHQLKNYLLNENFIAFVNSLRAKCEENHINGQRILGTPFTLGKVYFQSICILDKETSLNIIDILMRRIKKQKQSILDVFNK